jgi:hypothetical protein
LHFNDLTPKRGVLASLLTLGLLALISCGAEPPTFTPTGPSVPGRIIVSSTPAGAAIFLDGDDLSNTTPDTLTGLDPANYTVSVNMDGLVPDPAEITIDLQSGQTAAADFTLTDRAQKIVILEGFANVSCPPCPEMTDNLVAMTAKPGFGSDRVLFLEFAVSWPQLADPFFLANHLENTDRYSLYSVVEAPDLYIDGIRQDDALDDVAMENAVLAALDTDPGFEIDVTADFSGTTVPVTVTLNANRDLDLTGHVLFVAIFEKEVVIDPAPGNNGQTVFHHVFRDRVDTLPVLGNVTAGSASEFNLSLEVATAGSDGYVALAFVQHETSRAILQAGSTAAVPPSPERKSR